MNHPRNYRLDDEEMEILDAYESGRLHGGPIPPEMILAAKETMQKNRSIHIKVSERDLQSIKWIAAREGIPYQALISSLVHKYASGHLQHVGDPKTPF